VGTTTPRLGLFKAAYTDPVDVVADIDAAYDLLDASVGAQPVTAFPGSPMAGKIIQRTDQGDKLYYRQSTAGRFANIPFDTFFATKSADTTVNNSIAFVTDPDLQISGLLAGATYIWKAGIRYISVTATPDFNMVIQVPAGATGFWTVCGPSFNAVADADALRLADTAYGGSRSVGTIAATEMEAFPQGMFTLTASGTFQFQWAQKTATVENTTLSQYSWLHIKRVS
jgi:hypothetical protein